MSGKRESSPAADAEQGQDADLKATIKLTPKELEQVLDEARAREEAAGASESGGAPDPSPGED